MPIGQPHIYNAIDLPFHKPIEDNDCAPVRLATASKEKAPSLTGRIAEIYRSSARKAPGS